MKTLQDIHNKIYKEITEGLLDVDQDTSLSGSIDDLVETLAKKYKDVPGTHISIWDRDLKNAMGLLDLIGTRTTNSQDLERAQKEGKGWFKIAPTGSLRLYKDYDPNDKSMERWGGGPGNDSNWHKCAKDRNKPMIHVRNPKYPCWIVNDPDRLLKVIQKYIRKPKNANEGLLDVDASTNPYDLVCDILNREFNIKESPELRSLIESIGGKRVSSDGEARQNLKQGLGLLVWDTKSWRDKTCKVKLIRYVKNKILTCSSPRWIEIDMGKADNIIPYTGYNKFSQYNFAIPDPEILLQKLRSKVR